MSAEKSSAASTTDREITFSRLIDFPRELVWEAFTEPKHILHWWGPDGFTNTIHEMDVRPGGAWRFIMHGPNGTDYPNKIVYTEIVEPERLRYDHGGDGESERDDHFFHVTVMLDDVAGKTRVTLSLLFDSVEACEKTKTPGAIEGGKQTLARLEAYLANRARP